MHPSWSQGAAAARHRAPLRLALLWLGPFRLAPLRLAPLRSGPLRSGPLRSAALVAAVLAAAIAVAGCGHSAAAPPVATSSPSLKATICGTARTVANVPVKVEVTKGKVECHAALTVERAYTRAIAQGRAPGNGGGGPLTIKGWKCEGFPTPKVLQTGWASQCVRSGTQILAVLPPPSS
jgi:hypothetical protein